MNATAPRYNMTRAPEELTHKNISTPSRSFRSCWARRSIHDPSFTRVIKSQKR